MLVTGTHGVHPALDLHGCGVAVPGTARVDRTTDRIVHEQRRAERGAVLVIHRAAIRAGGGIGGPDQGFDEMDAANEGSPRSVGQMPLPEEVGTRVAGKKVTPHRQRPESRRHVPTVAMAGEGVE